MLDQSEPCPVCGAENPHDAFREVVESVRARGGPAVSYTTFVATCGACSERYERESSDDKITAAIHESEHKMIVETLDWFVARGVIAPNLERILRIPQRTTAAWREGRFTSADASLLYILRQHPELLDELDSGQSQIPPRAVPPPASSPFWPKMMSRFPKGRGVPFAMMRRRAWSGSPARRGYL